LWFDGCGSEGHEYDAARITGEIRRMQPNILIFNMWDPDTRWVGNEAGLAPRPCFNTVSALDFSIRSDKKTEMGGSKWLPAECDFRMRQENWFYSDKDEDTVKSLEELMGLYYYSVGRGANFLINIGPDRRGLLPEKDAARLLEMGREVRRRFSAPLAGLAAPNSNNGGRNAFYREGNRYVCRFAQPVRLNHLVAREDLSGGERIFAFNILVAPVPQGDAISVYKGESVGHKAICPFPAVQTAEVVFDITEGEAGAGLEEVQVFFV
jgi:alpha-L-fucosidase